MKILTLILTLMLNISTSTSFYANIPSSGVYLYKNADLSSAIFEIPESYFVKLVDYQKGYYKVEYMGIVGYVSQSQVNPTTKIPEQAFLTEATFRVFSSDGASLRDNPTKNSTIQCTLPVGQNIQYFGKIIGEELISERGNIWYYASYSKNNKTYTGYVYAGLCDMLLNVVPNTEKYEATSNPFLLGSNQYIKNLNTDTSFKIIIITIVSIPAVFLVYLIFKPSLIIKSKKLSKSTTIYQDEEL